MKKTIFITGSTDGIGKLAAIKLAAEGHEIYLHGRNAQKLEAVIAEVKAASNNEAIKGFTTDLSDFQAVRQLAQQINQALPKLDVLINNAGVYKSAVSHTPAGLDLRMVVNYLAPYLLTKDLIPLLRKGTAPRIINLSSAAQSAVSHDVLQGTESRSESETYAQSKLALTMWSFHLAKKIPDIAVIAVNPGSLLNTNMVKEAYGKFWSSADKGANILYDLAVLDKYGGITEKYFDNDQGNFGRAHPQAYNLAAIEKLISATEAIFDNHQLKPKENNHE
ncbi:MAG: SDR family NAD(P)-dependent oxidoreductase [Bacteroidota bacterium]